MSSLTKYHDGVWRVTTQNSSYVVDLEKRLFARIKQQDPVVINETIVEAEWFTLIDIYANVGGTMNVAIKQIDRTHHEEYMSSQVVSITKIA